MVCARPTYAGTNITSQPRTSRPSGTTAEAGSPRRRARAQTPSDSLSDRASMVAGSAVARRSARELVEHDADHPHRAGTRSPQQTLQRRQPRRVAPRHQQRRAAARGDHG
ncbi:MAG: hypothetical protein ACK559_40490, partial [bacterium]